MRKELAASRASLRNDVNDEVAAARKEEQERAAELAAKTHQFRMAKETQLVEFIKTLKIELQVKPLVWS